jgi:hypothetical protein
MLRGGAKIQCVKTALRSVGGVDSFEKPMVALQRAKKSGCLASALGKALILQRLSPR